MLINLKSVQNKGGEFREAEESKEGSSDIANKPCYEVERQCAEECEHDEQTL